MLPSFWIRPRRAAWFAMLAGVAGTISGPGCLSRYSTCPTPGCLTESAAGSLGGTSEGSGGSTSLAGGTGLGAAGGWAGNGGFGGEPASDPGPIGTLGLSCAEEGELACAAAASRFRLRCEGGVWTSAGQCSPTERCASEGGDVGTCQEVVAECLDKEPGDWVCRDALRFRCGTDLLEEEETETCANTCIDGVCTECIPGDDATCTYNSVRSCSAAGTWEETPCPAEAPRCSSGTCGLPPSCLELAQTCGPAPPGGSGSENCCTSLLVEGGTFNRENNATYPATISTFRLDRFEVTVGRFRKFKAAWDDGWRPGEGDGKHSHVHGGNGLTNPDQPSGFEVGWMPSMAAWVSISDAALLGDGNEFATWTSAPGLRESRPINFVSYYEVLAFCIWDGGFLPSTAEWNYAAVGGDEQRPFPWGDDMPGSNTDLTIHSCLYSGDATCTVDDIAPVGRAAGAGKFLQLDLAGNLRERTQSASKKNPCIDCTSGVPNDPTFQHHAPGGSFIGGPKEFTPIMWTVIGSDQHAMEIGFRCARPP